MNLRLNTETARIDCGVRWLSGKFSAYRLESRMFESHSSHHIGTIGLVLHSQLPAALWSVNSINAVLGAPLSSSGLEEVP